MNFRSNFLSCMSNSHSITVKHKYTKLDDFVVTDIWDGRTLIIIQNKLFIYFNNI
jgi:hypothetical protein